MASALAAAACDSPPPLSFFSFCLRPLSPGVRARGLHGWLWQKLARVCVCVSVRVWRAPEPCSLAGSRRRERSEEAAEAAAAAPSPGPRDEAPTCPQLSGGEKALTAIAILFAIQNLKPSPFCILDEIEAALDDSNIIRYAGYLRKLTKDVQFIVITHRKGTMEAADRLYGITMQERGVSTLISVDLTDYEEEQAG